MLINVFFCLQTLSQLPVVEDRGDSPELEGESLESEGKVPNDETGSVTSEGDKSGDEADVSHDDEGSHDNEVGVASVAVAPHRHKPGAMCPYGLPCVKELLRFLTSIISNSDK